VRRDEVMALAARMAARAGAAVFTGNGYNARALCALAESESHFYMLGSMGLCPALAAGFANRASRPVLVVEGDGNALMGLSGFPAVVRAARGPFVHLVLDNGLYQTTGSQLTLADRVDFGLVALGCGYDRLYRPEGAEALEAALGQALGERERTFVHLRTEPGSDPVHPRVPFHPAEVAARFRAAMAASRDERP
jgi:thiamine pyrophosphate-dependent acetolactate synthase large subunit-like protein